ncbi:MAG: hypothetical protein GY803_20740 [Chloroflexi bacterium]|nr:hypothetical protein [Chloroflexota bacterium]
MFGILIDMGQMLRNEAVSLDGGLKRPFQWIVLGCILTTFALYVYQLDGQSLWRDEALSVSRARQPLGLIFANRNVVDGVVAPDLHPPFYFSILHGWRLAAGESEWALRYPSVLFMTLAMALFYATGKRIWGRESGGWTVALAVFSPFFWWYAQEARMYALIMLESLLLLYSLWPLLTGRAGWKRYLLFALAAAALVFTHYGGAFLVIFGVLTLAFTQSQGRIRWPMLIAPAVTGGVALWLLAPHVTELLIAPKFFAFSQRPLWKLALEAINTFSLGSANPMENPGWRLLPFFVLGAVGALTWNVKTFRSRWRIALIGAGGFIVPLLLFWIASWLQANYSNPRHLTILSVPWYLLMGHGLTTLRQRWQPAAAAVGLGILAAGLPALYQTIQNPPIVKDDMRGLTAYIAKRARPGDVVLWHNAVMMVTYDYYALDLPYAAVPPYGWHDEEKVLARLAEWTADSQRIWFVDAPTPYHFDETVVRDWLDARLVRTDFAEFPASWEALHLRLYQGPQASLPTGIAQPVDIQDGAYQVLAIATEDEAVAGGGMWQSVLWSATETAPSAGSRQAVPPPSLCLRLRDSEDVLWAGGCSSLTTPKNKNVNASYPSTQQIWLSLPDGLAPTTYTLEALLGDTVQAIGTVSVARSEDFAPDPLAEYENGLALVSLEWDDETFRAGLWAVGNLVWYTESPLEQTLTATVRVVDWLGRSVAEQTTPLGPADYPGEQWRAGDMVRELVGIQLPFAVDGRYRAQIQLTDADGNPMGRPWTTIGWLQIEPWPMLRQLPGDVTRRLENVTWDETIHLAGYDIIQNENELTVKLYWLNDTELEADYGVFVHVGESGMPPIAQSSGGPANWTRPTTNWREGEIIEDAHTIQLPPDLDMAAVSVFVGLYEIDNPDARAPVTAVGEPVPYHAWPLAMGDE